MENTVETEGYYIADLGVNIEAPKDANANKLKSYAKKLNITPEYKVAMSGQNIPFNEQLYNATFSDIEVDDLKQAPRLDDKIYSRLAKQKYIAKGKDTAWGSTLLRSGWNQTVDIIEGTAGTISDLPLDIGASIAYATHSDELTPKTRAKWKDELADETLKRIKARKDKTSSIKFDVNEYESESAQALGSLLPSGLAMGALGISTILKGGTAVEAANLMTLPSLFFGGSSAQEMKETVLKNGGSIADATLRSMAAGTLEYFLEKTGLKAFNKFYKRKHLGMMLGASAGSEGVQEVTQTGKDILIAGDYDKRNTGQKLDDLFDSAWYGTIGGLAFNAPAAKSKYLLLNARERVYNEAVALGKDAESAIKIANYAVPEDGVITEDMVDFLNQELDTLPEATPEQMEKFKNDFDEATSVGGEEAESYITAKDEVKQILTKGGVDEERADREARMFTGVAVNGYKAYKDNEILKGHTPKSFNEFKDEYFKLNGFINHSIDDTNEMWADYDARNQTEFNEEQDMVEGKPSRKLYSFAGERAANLTKEQKTSLDEAKSLEGGLLSAEEIRQTTGWFRGTDNKWRLEISDKDASIKTENLKEGKLKLKDILEHNKLFKAYPQLKEANVVYSNKVKDVAEVEKSPFGVRIILGNGFTKESESEKRKTLMHEVQHLIQGMEKFARGGSSREFRSPKQDLVQKIRNNNRIELGLELLGLRGNSVNLDNVRTVANMLIAKGDPESEMVKKALEFQRLDKALAEYDKNTAYGKYLRLEGETESRNVATRIDLTEEERRAISPEMTRDVPREEAIIRFDDGTEINYTNQENGKLYQKAWHGGKELEGGKFSLKYAGKVTGQTHGYGVYASAQRDTGEYYRSRIDNSFTVKGEDITDLYSRLERKEEYDKLAIIEDLMLGKDVDALYEGTQEKAWFDKEIKPYLKSEGKLYELEVPEDYELIDEQKRFSEQPEAVQEVLLKTSKENKGFGLLEKAIKDDEYGGVLYNALGVDVFYETKGYEGGSTETRVAGSEFLDKEGIKGITYDGGTEGKNFVIFNPDNVQVLEKFYSKNDGDILGSYDPYTREVELFKGQNPSTLTHELGHHFILSHLKLMESMGLKDRNSPVFEWLSKVVGREINSVADMDEIEGDVINPHEALIESFISYMNEGEAPNLATKNIFQRAKEWILDRYHIHKTEASPEIKDYFDSLISRDGAIPDVSGLVGRAGEIREILKQAQNGEQVSFRGLGKKELKELEKAIHSRVRRKGLSLRDMLIARGGIKEGTELAKALGFDVLKRDKMFTTKDTAIEKEDELIEWLAEEGLIVGVQEGEDYSATEKRWEDVLNLIANADNVYTVRESLINQERETALANQAHAQEVIDEILKDNDLGLKDLNDLSDLLSRVTSKKDDTDIVKVNNNALKYLKIRMDNLNKEMRSTLKKKDKEFKNKREEQYQAQNDFKDFIRSLPINNQHKVALMGNIQRVKGYDTLPSILEDIKPRIRGYIEQEAKHLMRNNIETIIKSSKPKERKKQLFNYDYNKLFEELREYNKLTQEQAYEKLNEFLDKGLLKGRDKDGGEVLSEITEQDKVKNMLLQYKAKGMDTSLDLMKKLSDELSAIYHEAVTNKIESDIAKAEQREEKIKGVVDYIKNTKAVNKLNQKLLKMTNLNSNLSELFGKKWADAHKMDLYLIKQDMETNKALNDVIREGKEIYGLKNREAFVALTNEMRVPQEEFTLYNYRDENGNNLSKMQLIDIYLTIKNKGSAEAYRKLYEDFDEEGNQITTQIEDLLSNLTEEDKKFGDMLQKRVNDLYQAENKVYVKLYGIDMPKHENYWMRSSDPSERELMDIKQFMNLDMLPSFMKERAKAPSVYPDDAFKKFARRIHDSKYMTEVFEHYKELYDTIHSNRVKNAIVSKYDTDRYKVLNQSLKRISLGGVHDSYNELNNMLGKAITNWVVSKIGLSETVVIKQFASFTNYMENIPVADFVKYEAEFMANPKKAIEFMKEFAGDYLDHRFKSGIQNEVLQRIMSAKPEEYSSMSGAYQKYVNFVTLPVRFGDIGAIYIGGYARAKYLVEQGVPLEKAKKMFIEETESAQQSGNKAELSEFQNNPLWRVFTAFKNTNLQYMRKLQDSYIQYTRGEIDAKQFGKIWGNYMVVQSILYQVLTNIGTWWRDDDDEELQPMKDVWMRILTAPVAGFPIIGDVTEGIFAENYWGLNISGKQDMELFISGARDVLNGKFDAKKIAKGSVAVTSFFRPVPDRLIKGVINLIEE